MGILIVDDESELREVVADSLILSEIFTESEIFQANDGVEGLAVFEKHRPEIIMTDMVMPRMPGPELIRKIRDISPDSEIVVMTGQSDLESAISLFKYHVLEFLKKPFVLSEVLILIKKLKENYAMKRQNRAFKTRLIESEKLSSVGRLAAGVAHEINNPNTFIKGNLELIVKYIEIIKPHFPTLESLGPNLDPRIQLAYDNLLPTAEAAIKGSERIKKIVSGMLSLSRSATAEKSSVSAKVLIEEALALTFHRTKKHVVETHFEDPLHPLWVNSQEILQVLMNLITNAVDAIEEKDSGHGIGKIKITVTEDKTTNLQCISISDDGVGITLKNQSNLFEPFFTTKPAGMGTGLGLSISKEYVLSNDGTLEFESTPDQGTLFKAHLPIGDPYD